MAPIHKSETFTFEALTLRQVSKKRAVIVLSINLNKKCNLKFQKTILECDRGVMAQACKCSTEAGSFKVQGQLALHGKTTSQTKQIITTKS